MEFLEVTGSGVAVAVIAGLAWAAWSDPATFRRLNSWLAMALIAGFALWVVFAITRQFTWYEVAGLARSAASEHDIALAVPDYPVHVSLIGMGLLGVGFLYMGLLDWVARARQDRADGDS